jgi:hypothetical protein
MTSFVELPSKHYFSTNIRLQREEQPSLVLLARALIQGHIRIITKYPCVRPEMLKIAEELEAYFK